MPTFHDTTPKSCPPADAKPRSVVLHRLVKNNPPVPKDFVIWSQDPTNKHRAKKMLKQNPNDCKVFALSMYVEEGLERWQKRFPRAMKHFAGWAEVHVDLDSGEVKQTSKDQSHYSLWPYTECDLHDKVNHVKGL
ncbi:MAG: hypothetical protein ACPG8W_01615 [Candidatus Promineifilaceae bacterium]